MLKNAFEPLCLLVFCSKYCLYPIACKLQKMYNFSPFPSILGININRNRVMRSAWGKLKGHSRQIKITIKRQKKKKNSSK